LVAGAALYFSHRVTSSEWRPYSNPDYGFAFKYPVAIFPAKTTNEVNDADKTGFELAGTHGKLAILAYKTPFDPNNELFEKANLQNLGEVKIGDRTGYRYSAVEEGCKTLIDMVGIGSSTLSVAFASCEGDKDSIYANQALQDQILSTFTFRN
jgi:hypothetical protein